MFKIDRQNFPWPPIFVVPASLCFVSLLSLAFAPWSATGANPEDPPVFYVPLLLNGGETRTGIAVTNPSDSPATLTFEAYRTDGTPLWDPVQWNDPAGADPDGALLPGHQRSLEAWQIFGTEPDDARQGWIRITSDNPGVKVVYQYFTADLSALDGMNAAPAPRRRLLLPWILAHWPGDESTTLSVLASIVNPSDTPLQVRITPRTLAGTPAAEPHTLELPARGAWQGSPLEWLPSLEGPVVLDVEALDGPGIVASELVASGAGSPPFYFVSNGLDPEAAAWRLYSAQLAEAGGLGTFVCLVNPNPEAVELTLRARTESGAVTGTEYSANLPAAGFLLGNVAELLQLPDPTVGTLEVESQAGPVVGSVIFGDPGTGYAAALPLQAPTQGGALFPHVAHLPGWNPGFFTGLALHVVGTQPVRLQIQVFDRAGALTATGPREGEETLAPGGRLSKVLSELTDLAAQAGGSLRILTNPGALVSQELFGREDLQVLSAVPGYPPASGGAATYPLSPYIVVDQFGYLPDAEKVAVIRDPEIGYDAAESFTPGPLYALVEAAGGRWIYSGTPVPWHDGMVDPSSGDRAWWFDFSPVQAEGEYYVLDVDKGVRSPVFRIADDVYAEVLKHAVRTFFYQRAGYPKERPYADEGWTDGASHLGSGQDREARRWFDRTDPSSPTRDLSGGWYDAGDYNKYTNWTASYVIELFRAWEENPAAFGDDYDLPDSGNGLPDIVDEALWGLAWLVKMQNEDGSLLSVMGLSHASPPSAARGPSYYGDASTSATLSGAAAFAYSAKVLRKLGRPELDAYAEELVQRARKAWDWAEANPDVLFYNNSAEHDTGGLAAGQQEVDDYGRFVKKLAAACYLFEVTGEERFRDHFDAQYRSTHMFQWSFAYPFEQEVQDILLYYTTIPGATSSVAAEIKALYRTVMAGGDNLPRIRREDDPYRAYLKDYTWGSNGVKARQGTMFYSLITYGIPDTDLAEARHAAERYIHYLHGVNPLGFVYLSNMYAYGAERGVNEFYHSWFTNGSPLWDRVGVSTYGPAPGFLTGGPNPSYDWDACCPNSCGSSANNALCFSEPISPPKDQPAQKSYKDFNTSWPLNSWSVTENSCGYQVAYIRLLSKFVRRGE
ncbi:MAG: hypothetical protein Kow00109_27000 [Acidobacteriota bacterium]